MRPPYTTLYATYGLLLALGAPAGWLAWRALRGALDGGTVGGELAANVELYGYLLVATALAFMAFGALMGRLVGRLHGLNRELAEAALIDPTTGLKNRRYFALRIDEEIARSARDGVPLALIVGDLDHFKAINDVHGHAVGDRVLAAAGRAILDNIRAADSACRVGGEEFAIICPSSDLEEAMGVAQRIREAMEQITLHVGASVVRVTISLGVAVERGELVARDSLFTRADEAMYAAKRGGRNRVVVASRPSTEPAQQLPDDIGERRGG